jgi:ABC-2 type transport system permease protein
MLAIYKKEFSSYFRSPIGWVAIALFALMGGFYFSVVIQNSNSINMSEELSFLKTVLFVVIPLMTMRLFTEEKKNGTEVLMYTAPVSLFRVVIGKYLAALTLMFIMIASSLVHLILVVAMGGLVDASTLGAYIGFSFLAAVFIAIGTFCSAVTENQIIAAIISFLMVLFTSSITYIASILQNIFVSALNNFNPFNLSMDNIYEVGQAVSNAVVWFDPFAKTNDYLIGIFSVAPIIFCISLIVLFLFFTYRVLEKKRWSQG